MSQSVKNLKVNTFDSVFNDTKPTWESHGQRQIPPPTTLEYLWDVIVVSFTISLPLESMKYYPRKYALMFGTLAFTIMGFIFLYFTVTGYQGQLNQEFVSLDINVGDCQPVLQALTTVSMVSRQGFWENSKSFQYSEAVYNFAFSKLEVTTGGFEMLMNTFRSRIDEVGRIAATSPIMINLLYWMHFKTAVVTGDDIQRMSFTASPKDVYKRKHLVANIGSAVGLCNASNFNEFDVASGRMLVTWDVSAFQSENCSAIAELDGPLGWEPRDGVTATTHIDTIAVSTAAAVNLGIDQFDNLEIIGDPKPLYRNLVMTQRFDIHFPRMDPLSCISLADSPADPPSDDVYYYYDPYIAVDSVAEIAYNKFTEVGQTICLVNINDRYGIPTINHWQNNCNYCNPPGVDHDPYCDTFDVMLGVFFYPGRWHWTQIVNLYFSAPNYAELNKRMWNASYDLSNGDENAAAYDFCDGECKFIGVNTWDTDKVLSKYFLISEHVHCSDTFSMPESNFDALAADPPAILIEAYYRCKQFPSAAFISAVGIAAGNLGAFGPIAIIGIVLPVIYLYFAMIDGEVPSTKYDLVKILKAQREFIVKVLAANDGTLEGLKQDSVIHKIGVELYELAQFEEGVWDAADQPATPVQEVAMTGDAKVVPM